MILFDETRIPSVFQVILFDETDAYTKVHMICLLGESFPIAAYANGKTLCSCFGFVSDLFLFFFVFFPSLVCVSACFFALLHFGRFC